MKRYCFDTSGLSNPLEMMPEDIHESMWRKIVSILESDSVAVTTEIYEEMTHISGIVGECVRTNRSSLVLEVNQSGWNWQSYVAHSVRMNSQYKPFISEYSGNSPKTICLNDMTIVALAKTLDLPLVSMEVSVMNSPAKRRIPDICNAEGVEHLDFVGFLRREGIRI